MEVKDTLAIEIKTIVEKNKASFAFPSTSIYGETMIIIYAVVWEILRYYSYIVIAYVILSWLVSFNVLNSQNKLVFTILDFTYRLTEPLLRRIRNFLPNLGALDISPVILLFLIWILKMIMGVYVRPYLQI